MILNELNPLYEVLTKQAADQSQHTALVAPQRLP